jgi:hypothetical protein
VVSLSSATKAYKQDRTLHMTNQPGVCGMPGIVVYVLTDCTAGVIMAANAVVSWLWQSKGVQVERLAEQQRGTVVLPAVDHSGAYSPLVVKQAICGPGFHNLLSVSDVLESYPNRDGQVVFNNSNPFIEVQPGVRIPIQRSGRLFYLTPVNEAPSHGQRFEALHVRVEWRPGMHAGDWLGKQCRVVPTQPTQDRGIDARRDSKHVLAI